MARSCGADWCADEHAFCRTVKPLGTQPHGQFTLVRSGRRTYLSARAVEGNHGHYLMRGPVTLRKLAYAILREVPATKRPSPRPKARKKGTR